MNKHLFSFLLALAVSLTLKAQTEPVLIKVDTSAASSRYIPREIYGQFSEHLGRCIYGGLWVGEDSAVPNVDGYRLDVFNALKELHVPVLRWPGGCFADDYHWMDGIGPRENRPHLVNNNWGGTLEDNSFGTHEFLNLCEMLDIEPYISGNVGSGTVEEMSKWVEYMTADNGPMADLRVANGRKEPWKVRYFGVGNETWGCGGHMPPIYYSYVYRRYATYLRDYNGNHLYKVACGPSAGDYNWTQTMMENVHENMDALTLHYYTCVWEDMDSATDFSDEQYYRTLRLCRYIEPLIEKHDSIMSIYDPQKKVGLLVDEWGTWYQVEPGTNPGHLYQQNTMRDAIVASLSLDIFNRHTDRVRMANIAQVVNVLQAMILTDQTRMVLTPTYHVFKMYSCHQAAYNLASECNVDSSDLFSYTVSRSEDGTVNVSLTNADLVLGRPVSIVIPGLGDQQIDAQILSSDSIRDYNDFDNPETVKARSFMAFAAQDEKLTVLLPAASIVTLRISAQ